MKKWIGMMITGLCILLYAAGCGRENPQDDAAVRIGSLKGPTTLGLLHMMEETENLDVTMATSADELLPMMVKEELDVALVPANVAAILYQRTEGGVAVIDINTLGVLYMVSDDSSIRSMEDLRGRTIFLTGKGTTPDYVLQYLLNEAGIAEEVKLEYRSEATEVAVLLAEQQGSIGLLPQPFVTVACMQNQELSVVLDMTGEWERVQGEDGSSLVTGVTIVRRAFLEEHPEAVDAFLRAHRESAEYAVSHVEETAALAVEKGIIANQQVAVSAIPQCNIVYMEGEEMKRALSGYLEVLYGQSPESVGDALPGDDFYEIR